MPVENSRSAKVSVIAGFEDKFVCLRRAIEAADLEAALDAQLRAVDVQRDEFRVFIKPDMTFFFRPATTMTDPQLVECLVDWLQDRGFTNVAIGTSRDSSEFWLEYRDPLVLFDLAGYRFETPQGRTYDVVDLSENLAPAGFPPASVLKDALLSRAWLDAHFRISFGKCKTDEEYFYSGAVHNLLGVLPLADKELHYYHRLETRDVCSDLLHYTPVHFAIVDAYVGNQGNAGIRHSFPLPASTIIAGASAALVDWATALKMGLDPYSSPIVAKVLHADGLPAQPQVIGDLAPFPSCKNVHPMLADAVRKRNQSLDVQRAAMAWLQSVDRQLFPFKDALTDRVNSLLASQFGSLDSNTLAFAAFLALNYSLAGMNQSVEAAKVLFAKDWLHWMERPLNLKLEQYSPEDYVASRTYMEPLERIVLQLPPDSNGMRWQYMDKSVLFHFSHKLPIPFEEFVQRVDISQSIRMMNDYIGGACVPVLRDNSGRVTHQAERNIYLPQPNYIVLNGGQPIDVSKLEFITYSGLEHKIFWRTIKSENDTGRFDDGTVAFTKVSDFETLITVVGRQEFNLPPFWQLMNLDLNPIAKDYLVSDAYKNFFTRTLSNFESKFEGREYRVGHAWPDPSEDAVAPKLPSERLSAAAREMAGSARRGIDEVTSRLPFTSPKAVPLVVDENGFAHFEAPRPKDAKPGSSKPWLGAATIQEAGSGTFSFVKDLIEAVRKDLAPKDPDGSGS